MIPVEDQRSAELLPSIAHGVVSCTMPPQYRTLETKKFNHLSTCFTGVCDMFTVKLFNNNKVI